MFELSLSALLDRKKKSTLILEDNKEKSIYVIDMSFNWSYKYAEAS